MAEVTFQPDIERDELTYALGNPEHLGRIRGKGVVLWKYGFRDYIESYRSRQRRKNDEREHLRRLENSSSHTIKDWWKRFQAKWP